MAVMVPEANGNSIFESDAEKNVYYKLKSELPDDWIVLYSVWIRKARKKKHAEIDFLIFSDKACLIVEVKGGICWKDNNNMWHFRSKHGYGESSKKEGPFDQARTALHAVEKHFKRINRKSLFYSYNWGYAVITPECSLEVSARDIGSDPVLLLDERKYEDGLGDFVDKVSLYWNEENRRLKRELRRDPDEINSGIGRMQRSELADAFRQEVRLISSGATDMRRSLAASDALTDQQAMTLDIARDVDRILLKGGAGSGKTILAIEQAKRKAFSGQNVLFTCFNRALAAELRVKTESENFNYSGRVTISSFHSLVTDLIRQAGLSESIPDEWGAFNQIVFELVAAALDRLTDFEPFDYIVVDEGQDLMTNNFLDVLSLLQPKDISQSNWFFCYDPQQTIYLSNFETEAVETISRNATPLTLTKNCRNTRTIAAHVSCLSRTEPAEVLGPDGPDVEILYYEDTDELLKILRKTVNKSVTELIEAGFRASDLLILVPVRGIVEPLVASPQGFLRGIQEYCVNPNPDKVCWSTLHSFKGLEAAEVILTGFDSIGGELAQAQLYVGGSRARGRLHLLLAESDSSEVAQVLPSIIQMLSEK